MMKKHHCISFKNMKEATEHGYDSKGNNTGVTNSDTENGKLLLRVVNEYE